MGTYTLSLLLLLVFMIIFFSYQKIPRGKIKYGDLSYVNPTGDIKGAAPFRVYLCMSVTVVNDWTEITESVDTQKVYWAPSGGSDSNDGLTISTPKLTFSNAFSLMRDGYPDWLIQVDSWVGVSGKISWNKTGRSADEPMLWISANPTGRCQIDWMIWPVDNTLEIRKQEMKHVIFKRIHFSATGYDGLGNQGTAPHIALFGSGASGYIIFEDCVFERISPQLYPWALDHTDLRNGDIWRRCIFKEQSFIYGAGGEVGIYYQDGHNITVKDCVFGMSTARMFNGSGTPQRITSHAAYFGQDDTNGTYDGCFVLNYGWGGKDVSSAGGGSYLLRNGGTVKNSIGLNNSMHLTPDGYAISGDIINVYNMYCEGAMGVGTALNMGSAFNLHVSGCIFAQGGVAATGWSEGQAAINIDVGSGKVANFRIEKNIIHKWGNTTYEWSSLKLNQVHNPTGSYILNNNYFNGSGVNTWAVRDESESLLGQTWLQASGNQFFTTMNTSRWVLDQVGFQTQAFVTGNIDPVASFALFTPPTERTLTDFTRAYINSTGTIEDYFQYLSSRQAGTWDRTKSPLGALNYIRAGYGFTEIENSDGGFDFNIENIRPRIRKTFFSV